MDYNYLADLLFPNITTLPADIEARYPQRQLPEGAKVTRFAPSPTGFVHFGSLFPTRISERLAHQSGGVFYLRIEDTDTKREVEGAVENLLEVYKYYQIEFDESVLKGEYGPYRQTERVQIYQTFAKELIRMGKAYPCFCTEDELTQIRNEQKELKMTTGYYGKWAKYRDADLSIIEQKLKDEIPFVLRFKSDGNSENKIKFTDLIKGDIEITENDIDHVLLKSDGIPTYHLAHIVDDHLMQTTHVVRGEDWLPSLPFHIQLFKAFGYIIPKYLHLSNLLNDNGSGKKLSKRDNASSLDTYREIGYPVASITEYIMTLLNSNYEEWRMANPDKAFTDFPFSIKKMSGSGCQFDFDKLNDVSKNTISRMCADDVYNQVVTWSEIYDTDFADTLKSDKDYAIKILSIGRGGNKPRKDITVWSDVKQYVSLFYDNYFTIESSYPETFDKNDIKRSLEKFIQSYDITDTQETWFNKIKLIADDLGFASDMKAYKKNPQEFKGSVADISMFIRIAVTGKLNSPDMYEVMQILGKDKVIDRVKDGINKL